MKCIYRSCGENELYTVPAGIIKCVYRPCGATEMYLPSLRTGLIKCVYHVCVYRLLTTVSVINHLESCVTINHIVNYREIQFNYILIDIHRNK